ncbi:hypothetical protein V6N13_045373 [Hibiscus sabdariffa]
MTTRKRRESAHRVIVVLEGEKVATDKRGVVPLPRASKYASNNTLDGILDLALLSVEGSGPSSSKGYHGDHCCNYTYGDDPYNRFLRRQVSQKKRITGEFSDPFMKDSKAMVQ